MLPMGECTDGQHDLERFEPARMEKVLSEKLGAMNQICEWLGDSDATIESMTGSALGALGL
jgi:hypothetical protein